MPSLAGKVALVAGATRGAGRGIAVELGAAGATVYVTGRTTREQASEYAARDDRGNRGAGDGTRRRRDRVRVDHLVPSEVEALVARIRAERGRLDILVNDIWGGENLFEWNKAVWEHNLENGLRLLRLAVDTHLITAHYALPLMIAKPGGLLVEVTDGTAEYNAEHYRLSVFYDLAKQPRSAWRGRTRRIWQPHGATAVCITPGWMRSEMMLDNTASAKRTGATLRKVQPHFAISETPRFVGRAVAALAADPDGALERTVAFQRWPGEGLWLHRSRRVAAGLLALHRGSAGGRKTGRHDGVPVGG